MASLRSITVEPVLFMCACVVYFSLTSLTEYLYYRISHEYGLGNVTKYDVCNGTSRYNESYVQLESIVTSETSKWIIYTNVPGTLVSSFTAGIIGTWTDTVGRKPGILICGWGLCASMLLTVLTVKYAWPLYTLVIASIIFNLCGGVVLGLACCFSYLHDVTPTQKLTLAIAIGEVTVAFGGTVTNCLGGLLIQDFGFFIPYVILFSISVVNLFYVFVRFSTSGVTRQNIRDLLFLQPAMTLYRLIQQLFRGNTCWKIVVYLLTLTIFCLATQPMYYVLVLYLISQPFCLSVIGIGIVLGINNALAVTMVPMSMIFSKPKQEYYLLMVGMVLSCIGYTVVAIAQVLYVVYLGLALCLISRIGYPILRSHLSKLVSHSSQGALFSMIAIVEGIAILITSFAYNELYSYTAKTKLPGASLFPAVILGMCFMGIFSFIFWKSRDIIEGGYSPIACSSNADCEDEEPTIM